jgi:branched-chain amino acid transport system permease protein
MEAFGQILVPGIVAGSAYALFALGLALIYGTSRVLNFAYGSLFMAAAYSLYFLTNGGLHLPITLAALIVIPFMFLVGVMVEAAIVRPLRTHKDWKSATMMATLGLAFILDNFFLVTAGPGQHEIPNLATGAIHVLGVTVSYQDLFVVGLSALAVGALELFLNHTRLGCAMRAVSQDMFGANMVGISVNRIFSVAFGLSMALTGLAAVLLAPLTLISPFGGWPLFFKVFVIVVFGGLGSTRGALVAAILLGLVESAVTYTFGPAWVMPVWFLTLLAVLMFRPRGLMGVWAT